MQTVAALYIETGGAYFGLPGVEPWDEIRDARVYPGPHPVVAHPPCGRWCQLAPVNQARYGHKVGDDGGCFAAALAAVRRWGGVLEHPALTFAWSAHGIPRPLASGWIKTPCGGWTCQVAQRNYGHRARKLTWLYVFGLEPPELAWGKGAAPEAWVSTDRPRAELAARGVDQMGKVESKATPRAFRELLLDMARLSVSEKRAA